MVAGGRELIDTLWNVNSFSRTLVSTSASELIDTLWNVNRSFNAALTVSKLN